MQTKITLFSTLVFVAVISRTSINIFFLCLKTLMETVEFRKIKSFHADLR